MQKPDNQSIKKRVSAVKQQRPFLFDKVKYSKNNLYCIKMNKYLKNTDLRYFYRTLAPVLITFFIFIYIIFYTIVPSFRNFMIEQKKYFLKNTIQTSWHIIDTAYAKYLNRYISEDEAKTEVINTIESLRYGEKMKDYFWISNLDEVLIAHPYRNDLANRETGKLISPSAKKLFREFAAVTENTGENFHYYNWQLYDNPNIIKPKIAYLKRFKPWGWIIGTGLYIDDIEEELQLRISDMVFILIISTLIIIIMSMYSAFQTYKANKNLVEEEFKLQGIFNNSPHFMGLLNTDGSFAKANKTFIDFFQMADYITDKKKIWELLESLKDENIDLFKSIFLECLRGERRKYKTEIIKQNKKVYLDIFVQPLFISSRYAKYLLIEGNDITELVNAHNKLIEMNNELERIVKKRTEKLEKSLKDLKTAQEELIESEKLAALGNLVAGVAHEINTPMGITYTNITYINEKLHELNDMYRENRLSKSFFEDNLNAIIEALSGAIHNIERSSKLIKSFKNVAVDQIVEEKRDFDIKEYLNEVIMSIRPTFKGTNFKIIFDPSGSIYINSYPGIFLQIINNLINNSIQHGFEGRKEGNIDIAVEEDNDKIVINYSDDGIGMEIEELSKIFEPFFTTKRGHGGAGLGMNIVYNLVSKKLDGVISCKSSKNNGTNFIISFPK